MRSIVSVSEREKWTGLMYLLIELFLLPSALRLFNDWLTNPLPAATLNFIFFTLNFIAAAVIFHRFLRSSIAKAITSFWESVQAVILGYVAIKISVKVLLWIVSYVNLEFQNVNDGSIAALAGQNFYLIAAGVVFLVPVAEECFFRGVIFGSLHSKGRILAYAVSTLIFAAVHVIGYLGSYSTLTLVICYLQYLPAGLWLAWSYEKSGTIVVPIIIHGIINYLALTGLR